jgi:hypothetical protein
MRLNKKEFVELMKSLKELDDKDTEFSKQISDNFDCVALRYVPTDKYTSIIISLLNKMYNLKSYEHIGTDIEYFIYELDWGKNYKDGSVSDGDKNIDLSTPDKLYDYITGVKNE